MSPPGGDSDDGPNVAGGELVPRPHPAKLKASITAPPNRTVLCLIAVSFCCEPPDDNRRSGRWRAGGRAGPGDSILRFKAVSKLTLTGIRAGRAGRGSGLNNVTVRLLSLPGLPRTKGRRRMRIAAKNNRSCRMPNLPGPTMRRGSATPGSTGNFTSCSDGRIWLDNQPRLRSPPRSRTDRINSRTLPHIAMCEIGGAFERISVCRVLRPIRNS